MRVIQSIVVIVAIGLIFFVLSARQSNAVRAWKKIALCLLAVAMIITVLLPKLIDQTAHFLGVGLGVDLVIYILTLSFIVYVLNNYLHQLRERDIIFRLARKVAILDANEYYGIKKR